MTQMITGGGSTYRAYPQYPQTIKSSITQPLFSAKKENNKPSAPPEAKFYDAEPSRLMFRLFKLTNQQILRTTNASIRLSAQDKALLKQLNDSDDSVILAPNHPGSYDLFAMMETARESGIRYHSLGAIELFEPKVMGVKLKGIDWIVKKAGVTSVDRESHDKSKTMASVVKRVASGEEPFLIFPEGYTTDNSHTVETLKDGTARIALSALVSPSFDATIKTVKIVPISFYYHYKNDMNDLLEKRTTQLEEMLLNPPESKTLSTDLPLPVRVTQLVHTFLAQKQAEILERYPHLNVKVSLNSPFELFNTEMLTYLEVAYKGEAQGSTGVTEELRIKRLRGFVKAELASNRRQQASLEEAASSGLLKFYKKTHALATTQELEALKQKQSVLQRDVNTLKTLELFNVYSAMVPHAETQEQLFDLIKKLEIDVLKPSGLKAKLSKLRQERSKALEVRVKVGEPIDVKTYQGNTQDNVQKITSDLRQAIQHNLDLMIAEV